MPKPNWNTYQHQVRKPKEFQWMYANLTLPLWGREVVDKKFGTAKQDADHRDLTINSLFCNINTKSVEDLRERGISDLKSGKIVTPLPPKQTFLDDPLRVLRAIRFGLKRGFDNTAVIIMILDDWQPLKFQAWIYNPLSYSALYYQVKSPSFHLAEQLRPLDLQAVCCFLGFSLGAFKPYWTLLVFCECCFMRQKSGGPVVREWELAEHFFLVHRCYLFHKLILKQYITTPISNNDIGFGGNVLFKNELNQDIPLEKKIEDLYTDDIPPLPKLSFDATVKLKLYQVGELIHFYQNTSGHERGRPTLLVGGKTSLVTAGWGKNILGEPQRPLIGVLDWH
ncbi:hypothetical protein MTR67_047582, partial [Solanum verrucosum]